MWLKYGIRSTALCPKTILGGRKKIIYFNKSMESRLGTFWSVTGSLLARKCFEFIPKLTVENLLKFTLSSRQSTKYLATHVQTRNNDESACNKRFTIQLTQTQNLLG